MKVKDLTKLIEKLGPEAEIVVYRDANSRHCTVELGKIGDLDLCYFGGNEPDALEGPCLILEIYD